jgi:hypothetical protein
MLRDNPARTHRRRLLIPLAGFVLTVTTIPALARPEQRSARSPAQPKITWSQSHVEVVVSPAERVTRDLAFTTSLALENIVLEAVPEITPFVDVQPGSLGSLAPGQVQPVRLTFSIPLGTTLGTYEGTVHVRSGSQTLSQTLKIVLNVWPTLSNAEAGFAIKYPPHFAASQPEANVAIFRSPSADSLRPSPYISVEVVPNPDGKDIFDFYSQPDQPNFLRQSQGQFQTGTVDTVTYFVFNPITTLAGETVVVIPRPGYFLELVNSGASSSTPRGVFAQMISTLTFR